ncbi:methyltransferase [Flavobacterium terrae]|uniref:Release factor glutamine methyltransferase n=1 Tax=Flavobacterium terrae TaxID=415425 RepID=A0A1M6BH73_9FLAO|nr:methyltransferase [Flavobacterium terrae]SHI48072.1 release factor glutamine methyltransferase [Flavobacterium terrae]
MRNIIKKITHPFLKLGSNLYYSKPRNYCYENICVKVHPDVFPPHLTFSTKILLDFISTINLSNKKLLELGCGCGIISIYAYKRGAIVTATDINLKALEFLNKNCIQNNASVNIYYSDLFEKIEDINFDFIIINPPYYPKNPKSIKEQAWFCGQNFEYFESLFNQIKEKSIKSKIYMILSEDCKIENILQIAKKNEVEFNLIKEIKIYRETNFIFEN